MEATCSSEISVDFQRTTRRYIPKRDLSKTICCSKKVISLNYLLFGHYSNFILSMMNDLFSQKKTYMQPPFEIQHMFAPNVSRRRNWGSLDAHVTSCRCRSNNDFIWCALSVDTLNLSLWNTF
jgi:hypothetical protein